MTFAHPAWFALLVLVPLLAAGAFAASRLRRHRWHVFAAERLRASLLKRGNPWPRRLSFTLLLGALALLLGALARPQGDAGTRTETTLGRNLLFALDLSRSMRTADVKPDRLAQAKAVLYEILDAQPNDRVGVVGFAGSPYLFSPLTVDHAAVRDTVATLDENSLPTGGSNLAAAIRLSIDTLKKTGQKHNALVLLSDGEELDSDLASVIGEAESAGIYVFAVGVGTTEGGFIPQANAFDGKYRDLYGNPVFSRLQPDGLRKIAAETHGRFATAGSGVNIPALVREGMAGLDAFELKGRERRVFVEFFQWLVLPAVIALMAAIVAGTRWRGFALVPLAAAVLALAPQDTRAATADARAALQGAFSAWRENDFCTAREGYSKALLSPDPAVEANAHAGLGGALFQLGWQSISEDGQPYGHDPEEKPDMDRFDKLVLARIAEWLRSPAPEGGESKGFSRFHSLLLDWTDAIRHFDSALAYNPGDADARHNRELTQRYLDRLQELLKDQQEQLQQQVPQPKQNGKGDKQPKSGQGEGEPQDGSGQGEQSEQPDKGGKEPQDQGEKPDDRKNGKPDDGDKDDGAKPGETPEERARRILAEKADMQKGPLAPGRFVPRRPEKDW